MTERVHDGVKAHGKWTIRQFAAADLRDRADAHGLDYDELTPEQRFALAAGCDPVAESHTGNVTCIGLHQAMARALDGSVADQAPITKLAVGRGNDTSQITTGSTDLIDEVQRVEITEFSRESNGTELVTNTFFGEGDGNVDVDGGERLREAGLVIGDSPNDELANHALLDAEYDKTESFVITFEARISFTDSSDSGGS